MDIGAGVCLSVNRLNGSSHVIFFLVILQFYAKIHNIIPHYKYSKNEYCLLFIKHMMPKRLDRKPIYESRWINLYIDKVLMPSGKIIEKYHQLDYPKESITVLLQNAKGEICFIKSLRYTTQKIEWELPAGGIEKGEDILAAAEREVFEETGFKTKALRLLYSYNPSNGMSNQNVHIIFGDIETNEQVEFDMNEVKEVHWLSVNEIKKLIADKKISDGISLMPLLLYLSGITSR